MALEPHAERLPKVFARVGQHRLTVPMMFGLKEFLRFPAFCLKCNVIERFKRDNEIITNLQSTKSPQERNTHLVRGIRERCRLPKRGSMSSLKSPVEFVGNIDYIPL